MQFKIPIEERVTLIGTAPHRTAPHRHTSGSFVFQPMVPSHVLDQSSTAHACCCNYSLFSGYFQAVLKLSYIDQ